MDKIERLRAETAVATRRWANTTYYDHSENFVDEAWANTIDPFLKSEPIDYTSVIDLGLGHGRLAQHLLTKVGHLTGVDVLAENIEFCRKRFDDAPNLTLLRNDGVTLAGIPDASISFILCFDSMVHFDSDVVRSYLGEFRRVLIPGGHAFCHHSNRDRNPEGPFTKAAHARNFMTAQIFEHYAFKEGLRLVKNKVIDWGNAVTNQFVPRLDCFSLVERPQNSPDTAT